MRSTQTAGERLKMTSGFLDVISHKEVYSDATSLNIHKYNLMSLMANFYKILKITEYY